MTKYPFPCSPFALTALSWAAGVGSEGLLPGIMSQAQLDSRILWDGTKSVTDIFGGVTSCAQCIQHLDSGLTGHRTRLGWQEVTSSWLMLHFSQSLRSALWNLTSRECRDELPLTETYHFQCFFHALFSSIVLIFVKKCTTRLPGSPTPDPSDLEPKINPCLLNSSFPHS